MRVSPCWPKIWAVRSVYAFHILSRQLIEDMLSAFHSRFRTVLPGDHHRDILNTSPCLICRGGGGDP
jgi:hypothetical protein